MLQKAVSDLVVTKLFGITDTSAATALSIDNSMLISSNSVLSKLKTVFMEVVANDSDNSIITGGYTHLVERIGKKAYVDGQRVKLYKKGFVRFVLLYGKAMFLQDCITYYLTVKIVSGDSSIIDVKFSIRSTRYTLKSRVDVQCQGGNAHEIVAEIFSTSIFSRVLHFSLDVEDDTIKVNNKKIKDNHLITTFFTVDDDSYIFNEGIDGSTIFYTASSKSISSVTLIDIASMTNLYGGNQRQGIPTIEIGLQVYKPPVNGNYVLRSDFLTSKPENPKDPQTYTEINTPLHIKSSDIVNYSHNDSVTTIINTNSLTAGFPINRIKNYNDK